LFPYPNHPISYPNHTFNQRLPSLKGDKTHTHTHTYTAGEAATEYF